MSAGELLVGRALSSLLPEELEELANLCGKETLANLDECEGDGTKLPQSGCYANWGEDTLSLHPKYKFLFCSSERGDMKDLVGHDLIEFFEWYTSGGEEPEPGTHHYTITVGAISGPYGDNCDPVAVVRWFLDHGWHWADEPSKEVVTCVYCGHAYENGTPTSGADILTAHIRVCEKHPLRKSEAQVARLRGALEGFVGASSAEDLRGMESMLRLAPAPAEDKAKAIDAIHALLSLQEDGQ